MANRDPVGGPVTARPKTRGRTAGLPFFDVADPAFSVSSAAVHRARENDWHADTSYGIAVLRYDQASRLIRHPAVRQGSVAWPAHHGITSGPFADWWSDWVLNKEGEDHQRLRRLLNPAFSRRLAEALVPRFSDLAGGLIRGFAKTDRCEFMAEFAEPYAARVIAIILGIPENEWRTIAAESAAVGLAMGVRIRENLPRIEAALANLYAYADGLIADRRARPGGDFVTTLVEAQVDGERLTARELRGSLVLLIFGGFDTTRNQLGLAMQVFMDHPRQWRLLAERPELGPAAVEEVMRVSPTTTWVTREAVADFTFDGLEIKSGTTIHLFCAAAGTDPRAFGDAEFDITVTGRPPHFGFGGGVHYCLGHLVARTDMSAATPARPGCRSPSTRYDLGRVRYQAAAGGGMVPGRISGTVTAVCEAVIMSQSPVSRSGPFWEVLEGRRPAPAAATTLGWELSWVAPERGEIEVFFEARHSFTNPMGNVQGGFLAAMLDDTLGPALVATLPDGQFAPTLELKVSFLRPAAPGRITGTGRVVHRGGSIAFLAGELRNEAGELLATATATARIIRPGQ